MNTSGSESYERRRCGKFSAAAPTTGEAAMNNELEHARADFPILSRQIRGKPLVYLDNAASMQMSRAVMKKMREQQAEFHANVHRGIHYLSERSTERMEKARETVRRFINAESAGEIIFTSGSTQSVNLAAMALEGTVIMRGNAVAGLDFCARKASSLQISRIIPVIPLFENLKLTDEPDWIRLSEMRYITLLYNYTYKIFCFQEKTE